MLGLGFWPKRGWVDNIYTFLKSTLVVYSKFEEVWSFSCRVFLFWSPKPRSSRYWSCCMKRASHFFCFFPPQTVIDANIFPVLIDILQKAEFRTRKEAAWAITNATSGGTPEQIRFDRQTTVYEINENVVQLKNEITPRHLYTCQTCPCLLANRYLVNLGCIKPLCDLLTVMDSKIVQVALNGLENILRLGEQEAKQENNGSGVNPYCSLIEEAYGTAQ